MGMHRDLGMVVRPQQPRAFESDGAITERSALRAASDDADMLSHGS